MPTPLLQSLQSVMLVLLGVVFIALLIAALRANRARQRARAKIAESLGLTLLAKPTKAERNEAFAGLDHLKGTLKGGASNLISIHTGTVDGSPVRLLTHRYQVDKATVVHTLVALPCPAGWPDLDLAAEHLGHKLMAALGTRDMQLEDPVFNAKLHIRTGDEGFALLLLTPEVQAFLLEDSPGGGPKKDRWILGHGSLCLLRKGHAKPETIGPMVRRAITLRALAPRELDAYAPA